MHNIFIQIWQTFIKLFLKGAGEWKASLEQEMELYFPIGFPESSKQATTVWNILNTKPNHISNEKLYYTTAAPPRQLSDCFYFLFSEIAKNIYCDLKIVKNWKIGAFKYFFN